MSTPLLRSMVSCRRRCAVAAPGVLLLLAVVGWWAEPVGPAGAAQEATLRERLVYGLLAKIPSELAYIDNVVEKVDTGKLPVQLVNETFFWARERAAPSANGSPRRPIIFFEPAMTARAKRIGVEL
jgi:hypothetical protein